MSETVQIKAPWLASKDPEVPSTLNYSTLSMCGRVEEMVRQYPNYTAYEFMGKTTTYAEMWQKINACAKSLKAIGIREGDKVTICMPNAPQTLCMFYAVNMVGAIANMVHRGPQEPQGSPWPRRGAVEGFPEAWRARGDLPHQAQGHRSRRYPLLRRHHRRHQGHPALQPQL